LVAGDEGRTYFKAKSLKTKTSGRHYAGSQLPVFTIHTDAEAKTKPFVAIFEPYKGKDGYTIDRIVSEKTTDPANFTVLTVYNKNNTYQEIFQSTDPVITNGSKSGSFKGYFAIANVKILKNVPTVPVLVEQLVSLYLGKGAEITSHGFSLKSTNSNGSANLTVEPAGYRISCNQETEIGLPGKGIKKAWLQQNLEKKALKMTKTDSGILVTLQAIKDGWITLK
jgi:hypothetical protein